ncbi:hypothetical protein, partial [Escherichia coli]|uniref:hypothetical protein n=1 Tax=Escherichia coli TaxID=562 RepID=UPI002235B14F
RPLNKTKGCLIANFATVPFFQADPSLSPTMTTEVAVNAVPINFNINNELTLLAWFFASLALKPQYS